MDTAVINFRTSTRVKTRSMALAEELGMDLSSVLNGLLAQFLRTKTLVFSTKEEPSAWMIKNLAESEADIKAGRVTSFKNPGDEIAFLDKMIEDDKRRKNNLLKKVAKLENISTLTRSLANLMQMVVKKGNKNLIPDVDVQNIINALDQIQNAL